MDKMDLQDWFLVIGLLFILVATLVSVHAHETVHQQIFAKYNIDSEIQWFASNNSAGSFMGVAIAQTMPDSNDISALSSLDYDAMYLEHTLHESVSYPQQIWGFFVMVLVFVFGLFWFGVKK